MFCKALRQGLSKDSFSETNLFCQGFFFLKKIYLRLDRARTELICWNPAKVLNLIIFIPGFFAGRWLQGSDVSSLVKLCVLALSSAAGC